jgi:anti-anti-sigma regulatory factor
LIPRAVLSALIMVVAIQHIDPWTKELTARLFKPGTPQRSAIMLDLGVAMFVSVLSIAINVVPAVFVGIVLAIALFVIRMSRSNIRRMYRCDSIRSRRSRDAAEMATLRAHGASILVVELQGALFFGSAERLAQIVDRETVQEATQPASTVLLDLRRITEIDATGARIVADIDASLTGKGLKLALVLSNRTETAARIAEVFHAQERVFPDVDRAIEWAEDAVLRGNSSGSVEEVPLDRVPLLRDFTSGQIERLRPRLEPMTWKAGSVVFRQGDPGSALFLLTRGRASVYLPHDDRGIRLMTFGPGAVFGELAILDGGPRSATVTADEELKGFGLSDVSFAALREREPEIAIRLLAALGRELSVRLRYANLTIQQLET